MVMQGDTDRQGGKVCVKDDALIYPPLVSQTRLLKTHSSSVREDLTLCADSSHMLLNARRIVVRTWQSGEEPLGRFPRSD